MFQPENRYNLTLHEIENSKRNNFHRIFSSSYINCFYMFLNRRYGIRAQLANHIYFTNLRILALTLRTTTKNTTTSSNSVLNSCVLFTVWVEKRLLVFFFFSFRILSLIDCFVAVSMS